MLVPLPRNKDPDWLEGLTYLIGQGRRQEQSKSTEMQPFRGFASTVASRHTKETQFQYDLNSQMNTREIWALPFIRFYHISQYTINEISHPKILG